MGTVLLPLQGKGPAARRLLALRKVGAQGAQPRAHQSWPRRPSGSRGRCDRAEYAKSPTQPDGPLERDEVRQASGQGGAAVGGPAARGRLPERGRSQGPLQSRGSSGAQKGTSEGGAREAAGADETARADGARDLAGAGEDSEAGGNLVGTRPDRHDRRHGQAGDLVSQRAGVHQPDQLPG